MKLPDYWLPRPAFSFNPDTLEALEQLYEERVRSGGGHWIHEALPVPIWQFLCWLADEQHLLLHGSGDPNITEFEPRQSNDIDEFGNRKAVYAASDGLWAMFFAVIDRVRYPMSISNAAIRLEQSGVLSDPHYFFSMTDRVLSQQPWREGVIYLLPRDGFEAQRPRRQDGVLIHSNQWASLNPVKPLAKVRVQPEDFPFLAQIRGHDDDLLWKRAERNPNGFPWLED